MALPGINNKKELQQFIRKHLSRAHPIRRPELLYGREIELKQIERSLYSDGTHVFVIGDRGVGKTSVATIAAGCFQEGNEPHFHIGCGPTTTFASIVANIAYKALKHARVFERKLSKKGEGTVSVKWFKLGGSIENVEQASQRYRGEYS